MIKLSHLLVPRERNTMMALRIAPANIRKSKTLSPSHNPSDPPMSANKDSTEFCFKWKEINLYLIFKILKNLLISDIERIERPPTENCTAAVLRILFEGLPLCELQWRAKLKWNFWDSKFLILSQPYKKIYWHRRKMTQYYTSYQWLLLNEIVWQRKTYGQIITLNYFFSFQNKILFIKISR